MLAHLPGIDKVNTKNGQKQLSEVELNSIQDQLVALKIISKKAAFSEITK